MSKVDRVLHDADLLHQRRRNVDGNVRKQQRARIVRDIHQIGMTDMPRRAQTCLRRDDSVHQLLGVQIALHQQCDFAGASKCYRLGRGSAAVRCINQAERGNVRPRRRGDLLHARRRPDQDRHDQPCPCCVQGGQQRGGIDRMYHRCRHRGATSGAGQDGGRAIVTANPHIRQRDTLAPNLHVWRPREGGPGDHGFAVLVGTHAVKRYVTFFRLLLSHRHCRSDGVANRNWTAEAQILAEIDRSRTRQLGAEHGGDQPRPPHALDNDMVEHVRFGVDGIDMRGVHVACDDREQVDVALRYGVRRAGRLAEGQLVEGPVLDVGVSGFIQHQGYPSRT